MTLSPDRLVLDGAAAADAAPFVQTMIAPAHATVHTEDGRDRASLDSVFATQMADLREQAHQEGFEAGYTEGIRGAQEAVAAIEQESRARQQAIEAEWAERQQAAAAALASAAARMEELRSPVLAEVSRAMAEGLFVLTEDLLGRELAAATDPGLDAIRRALAMLPADAPAVVRLHPEDAAALSASARAELSASVTVVADPAVERSGAVAEAGARRVDAQISAAVARARAVLAS